MLGTNVGVMLKVTLALAVPAALVAVIVATVGPPLAVGVPEITPVFGSMVNPAGIPVAVKGNLGEGFRFGQLSGVKIYGKAGFYESFKEAICVCATSAPVM